MISVSIQVLVGEDCNAIADYVAKLQATLSDRGLLAPVVPAKRGRPPLNPATLDAIVTPADGPLARQYKMERVKAGKPISAVYCKGDMSPEESAKFYLIRDYNYNSELCDIIAKDGTTGESPINTTEASNGNVSEDDIL